MGWELLGIHGFGTGRLDFGLTVQSDFGYLFFFFFFLLFPFPLFVLFGRDSVLVSYRPPENGTDWA